MPEDEQKEIFTGLTKEEKNFVLDLFKRVQINVTDENAIETCTVVKSITLKFQNEKES